MSLSFGASTFSFIRQGPALESMRSLRGLGYRTMDVLAVPGHLWPAELSASARSQLRRSLERDDIVVESINPQPVDLNIGSCLAEVRDYSVSIYTEAIRLATDLGAAAVVVVPGRVAALPPSAADTLRWTAESVAALSEVAREAGLAALWIENHPTSGFASARAVCGLVDEIGADNVGVAYDVANAEFVAENQVEAIRNIGRRLGQTHFSDAKVKEWAHDPLGQGTVNFSAIFEELESVGSTATNVVELISADPVADYARAAKILGL